MRAGKGWHHWNRLPSRVMESLSLEECKRCAEIAFKDTV